VNVPVPAGIRAVLSPSVLTSIASVSPVGASRNTTGTNPAVDDVIVTVI
jgi:hypothetical protein